MGDAGLRVTPKAAAAGARLALRSDGAVRDMHGDLLGFRRYVDPLVDILTHPDLDTPFTVGLFGTWGSGKSSLLSLLDHELHRRHDAAFVRVHFNPWMHRSEPNMLVPLLHALHDTLEQDPARRFMESARKLGNVLLRLGLDTLLKRLTADAASLDRIDQLEERYLKAKGRVESELRTLRQTLQAEADAIAAQGARVIFFIDDLDRCDPEQIVDLLEALKLFFDLRHTVVILAVDKEVVDRGIEVKYGKFAFASGRAPVIGSEYLEKMVQLPLHLFPLHASQVADFMKRLGPPPAVAAQLPLLQRVVAPNPRRIKRILNILTLTDAVIGGAATPFDFGAVTRLVVLQVQHPELYAHAARMPELLDALHRLQAGELRVQDAAGFAVYGTRAQAIIDACRTHFQAGSAIADLFDGSPFHALHANGKLPIYLSMLGG